jgi:hypothetical protein
MDWKKEVERLFNEANEAQTRADDVANRLVAVRNRISTSVMADLEVAPGDLDAFTVLTSRLSEAHKRSIDLAGEAFEIVKSHLPPKK